MALGWIIGRLLAVAGGAAIAFLAYQAVNREASRVCIDELGSSKKKDDGRRESLHDHTGASYGMHHKCVVCRKSLSASGRQVARLPCGHVAVHAACLPEASCPLCSKQLPAVRRDGSEALTPRSSGASVREKLETLLLLLRKDDDDSEEYERRELASCKQVKEEWMTLLDTKTRGPYIARFNDFPKCVVPSEEEDKKAGAAVNKVFDTLSNLPNAKVDRVHMGGSYGRKTSVRGRSDVDLLVFVNDIRPEKALDEAVAALKKATGNMVKKNTEKNMVKLEVDGVEMDVPLVINHAKGEKKDKAEGQRDALVLPLLDMTLAEKKAYVLADPARERGVGETLTMFVEEQHKTANEAVRLFKAWVKYGLSERSLKELPSIALELIVLAAWQKEGGGRQAPKKLPDNYDRSRFAGIRPTRSLLLRVFIQSLMLVDGLVPGTNPGSGAGDNQIWVDAGELGYLKEQGQQFRHCWGETGPFIIHPIDPTCNVARAGGDWAGLAKEARALLNIINDESLAALLGKSTFGAALRGCGTTTLARPEEGRGLED